MDLYSRWPLSEAKLRKKYKKAQKELVKEIGDELRVLDINLVTRSKMKNQWIYSCKWVKEGIVRDTNILAHDITEALFKLDKVHDFGMSERVMHHVLTSPHFSEHVTEVLNKKK